MEDNTYYAVEGHPHDRYIYYHFIYEGKVRSTRRFTQSQFSAYLNQKLLKKRN